MIGRDSGVTDADIRSIVAEINGEATGFTSLEKAVLKAARELTAGPSLSDKTHDELKKGQDNEKRERFFSSIPQPITDKERNTTTGIWRW